MSNPTDRNNIQVFQLWECQACGILWLEAAGEPDDCPNCQSTDLSYGTFRLERLPDDWEPVADDQEDQDQ